MQVETVSTASTLPFSSAAPPQPSGSSFEDVLRSSQQADTGQPQASDAQAPPGSANIEADGEVATNEPNAQSNEPDSTSSVDEKKGKDKSKSSPAGSVDAAGAAIAASQSPLIVVNGGSFEAKTNLVAAPSMGPGEAHSNDVVAVSTPGSTVDSKQAPINPQDPSVANSPNSPKNGGLTGAHPKQADLEQTLQITSVKSGKAGQAKEALNSTFQESKAQAAKGQDSKSGDAKSPTKETSETIAPAKDGAPNSKDGQPSTGKEATGDGSKGGDNAKREDKTPIKAAGETGDTAKTAPITFTTAKGESVTTGAIKTGELRPTQADTAKIIDQAADRMALLSAKQSTESVTIHLSPKGLGDLTVIVKAEGQKVDAEITASNEHVQKALEQNSTTLVGEMSKRGLELRSVQVGAQTQTSTQQHPSQNSAHSQNFANARHEQRRAHPAGVSSPIANAVAPVAPSSSARYSSVGVDLAV